jgi:dolichyl-phosphate-mannose-protein mannosyltransferase
MPVNTTQPNSKKANALPRLNSAHDVFSDTNNLWKVEILHGSSDDEQSGKRLRALRTFFRLIHVNMDCALYTRDKSLPAWASHQNEVTCMKYAKKDEYTTFFIESSQDSRCKSSVGYGCWESKPSYSLTPGTLTIFSVTDEDPIVEYAKPSFWKNFVALNTKMYTSNEALTVSHNYESRPGDWAFLHRGINYWAKEQKHIYLLGNPLAYWASSIAAAAFLIAKLAIAFREQRGVMCADPRLMSFYRKPADFFATAWLLHWLPFFTMKRQLFLHHYMPSLYFAMLISIVAFEYATKRLSNTYRYSIATAVATIYLYMFWYYSPITYGLDWNPDTCDKSRLRSSWDFNCEM